MVWIAALGALHANSSVAPANLAVAASFRALWPELMSAYTRDTGKPSPRVSFGSSGLLTTQIRHGAPFDLYLSADQATVKLIQQSRPNETQSAVLVHGTLSMISTKGTVQNTLAPSVRSLAHTLKSDPSFKIALPNPRHAPYGVAARELLSHAGLWPLPPGTVLWAENAAQTLQFARSGAVDFAIVPTTLIHAVPDSLHTALLDDSHYSPVAHHLVLLKPDNPSAQSLFSWLQGASAQQVLTRYGLSPP